MNKMYKEVHSKLSKEELFEQLFKVKEENCSHRSFLNQLEAGTAMMTLIDSRDLLDEMGKVDEAGKLNSVIEYISQHICRYRQ